MKKVNIWLAVIFAVMLGSTMMFAACGPADDVDDGKNPENPDAPIKFAVTYNLNYDNSTPIVREVEKDKTALRETPIRTGWTLKGWYTDAACTTEYVFTTPVTKAITIYAKWEQNTYKITFDLGGGSGTIPPEQTVTHGELATKPADPGERADYVFQGWVSGGAAYDFTAPVIANLTITAKWLKLATSKIAAPATADFRVGGGEGVVTSSIEIERTAGKTIFGEAGEFAIEGIAEMRVYIYNTAAATSGTELAYFSVFQDKFTSSDGAFTVAGSEAEGGNYNGPGNYYVFGAVLSGFLEQVLGDQYVKPTSNNAYWFRVQFIAAGNAEYNSDLGPVTSAWPGKNFDSLG